MHLCAQDHKTKQIVKYIFADFNIIYDIYVKFNLKVKIR